MLRVIALKDGCQPFLALLAARYTPLAVGTRRESRGTQERLA